MTPREELAATVQKLRDELAKLRADADALDQLADMLDGHEWDAGTLDAVAEIVHATGREVRNSDEFDDEEPDEESAEELQAAYDRRATYGDGEGDRSALTGGSFEEAPRKVCDPSGPCEF